MRRRRARVVPLLTAGSVVLASGLVVAAAIGTPFTIGEVMPVPLTRVVLAALAPPVEDDEVEPTASTAVDAGPGGDGTEVSGDDPAPTAPPESPDPSDPPAPPTPSAPDVTVTALGSGRHLVEACGDLAVGGALEVRRGGALLAAVTVADGSSCASLTVEVVDADGAEGSDAGEGSNGAEGEGGSGPAEVVLEVTVPTVTGPVVVEVRVAAV